MSGNSLVPKGLLNTMARGGSHALFPVEQNSTRGHFLSSCLVPALYQMLLRCCCSFYPHYSSPGGRSYFTVPFEQ